MKKNSFIEGSFIATFTILLSKLLGIIYVVPFYAIIGASGATLYSYAYNVYVIFLNISSAGIPNAISKLISEYNTEKKIATKIKVIKLSSQIVLIFSVITFLVLFIFSKNIASLIIGNKVGGNSVDEISLALKAISLSILVVPFLSITRGFLQGHKIIKESSNSQIIEQIIRIIVILLGSYLVIKVLNKDISIGISTALLGSFIGGICSFLYLVNKIKKNKKVFNLDNTTDSVTESNKEIIKKIVKYSLPFIVITITANLFNVIDMTFIIRLLSHFGYNGADSEFVASVITTWGDKFNSIINAIASGVTISLIPHLVSSYTLGEYKKVNLTINKALRMVIYVSIPLSLFISLFASNIWNLFYDESILGPKVLQVSVLTAVFCNIYLICIQIAQSLNRYKTVYISVIFGFFANAILDIPFMYLCHIFNIFESYGASIATICGFSLSILIIYYNIRKINEINLLSTFKSTFKILVSSIIMISIILLVKSVLNIQITSRIFNFIYLGLFGILGLGIYIFLTYKMQLIKSIFGEEILNKVKKIIHYNR